MKTTRAKGAKAKADRLFSQLVRSRGACEHCDKTENLQCAHVLSRRFANTRTDLDNAYCLCAGCHMMFTNQPVDFGIFVLNKMGADAYDALELRAHADRKVDWEAEVARLESLVSA